MRLLKYFVPLIIFVLHTILVNAQNACTALGQTPSTAFPVCGVDTFSQSIVPNCGYKEIPGPCNGIQGVTLQDLNPFWYRFTCFKSGTLGFLIEPDDQTDDYDWQLFDITGHSPDDVYTHASLFVACNWSGLTGNTGASASGTGLENCAGTGYPLFSEMPNIIEGHQYLLLLSHFNVFNPGQEGYKLSFGGGTSSITDTTGPRLLRATASCDGNIIRLKLNKKMKCASLKADGSDFSIQGQTVKVVSATGVGCSSSFDVDSVILTLETGLAPGNYKIVAQKGTDGNTLLDNCDNGIPEGTTADFTVYPRQPTPFDSIVPPSCAPQSVQLVFQKNIRCSTIAPNGSDFYVTGSYPVIITGAEGVCNDGLTSIINVQFSAPLVKEGTFTLHLQPGFDGNTIIDECGEETVWPASIDFSVKDTVSADFTYSLTENCDNDKLDLFNNGGVSITNWQWTIDGSLASTIQNPSFTFTTYGTRNIQLVVTNGFCTDTTSQVINLPHDTLIAGISGPSIYCPDDVAIFTDSSRGTIVEWNWQFGNGRTSNLHVPPPQSYYTSEREKIFPVSLAVKSARGCYDTAIHFLKVASNCHIAVPTGFTPNGDGNNDYLYPLNAYKATNLHFVIYNRQGQKIYETKDWTRKWDGTFNGHAQPTGVYVWMLRYKDETGKEIFQKGASVLLR